MSPRTTGRKNLFAFATCWWSIERKREQAASLREPAGPGLAGFALPCYWGGMVGRRSPKAALDCPAVGLCRRGRWSCSTTASSHLPDSPPLVSAWDCSPPLSSGTSVPDQDRTQADLPSRPASRADPCVMRPGVTEGPQNLWISLYPVAQCRTIEKEKGPKFWAFLDSIGQYWMVTWWS
jgi:hypothetical protein